MRIAAIIAAIPLIAKGNPIAEHLEFIALAD
jgi:hypothetical protein